MSEVRARRGLVPLEVAAVLAIAIAPLPVPRVVPLLAVASASRWARGRAWVDVLHAPARLRRVGAAAGLAALVLALVAGTPAIEALTGQAVVWSQFPIVRGNAAQLLAVAVLVAAAALATELVLRGWIVERVLELARPGPVTPALAVLVGALAEALITGGDVAVRLGAAVFGLGLGTLHVAAGRDVLPPLYARLAFVLGALVLEWQRLVS